MFCLLPTLWKQQQIAILIISFSLYVNGIRNEGNNMLQRQQHHRQQEQQQQQTHAQEQQQQQQLLQPLHATIENSNYQSPSSSSNSVFKPSQLLEFTLADAAISQSFGPTYHEPSNSPSVPSTNTHAFPSHIDKTKDQQENRRRYSTNNGETQFLFPNEQQQVYAIPQRQQQQQLQRQEQELQHPPAYQQQRPERHFTEMPIYTYKDPYTNENYHYTPTEPTTILEVTPPQAAATYTASHNDNALHGYQQQLQQLQQDNQEYLVHSSMTVGTQPHPLNKPNAYLSSDKDVYLKRPGLVYDESYVPHPNAVVEKKRDTVKTNKISYDSHDYPPPSYAQQQTSNFLPTPVPERPPTPRPPHTQSPVRRPPSYAASPPPQDYRPRPTPPPQPNFSFGRPPSHQQQSSQNALPNYANNLDNYLSNKQQGPYYQTERPPSSYLQQQTAYYERPPVPPPPIPSHPQYQQQQYQSSYPPYENPQYHQPTTAHPSRPSYNNYYNYQIGEVPPQSQGSFHYPYPRPPNGPYRPPPPPPAPAQASGLASLVQYAPQFTSLLLGGVGGGGGSSSNTPLGSLLGALTGVGNGQQISSLPSSSSSLSSFNRRPINAQLIRALENIARNDDLQCVPKVVCQMISAQVQRGQLPSFVTSPAITNFLAGFPAASPALIYGRAALLGISGGDKICHSTYVQCPKNEVEIIYYLNNHRGGFFKFFSEPEPQATQTQDVQESQQPSFFSILSALTGMDQSQALPATTPRPRPKPQPAPSSDITSTIGNFFTNLLSDYMGEGATVEYQRRRMKRSADRRLRFVDSEEDEQYDFTLNNEDYNDEEDTEDTEANVDFTYKPEEESDDEQAQSRGVKKSNENSNRKILFPDEDNDGDTNGKDRDDVKSLIQKFNDFNMGRKLKFPSETTERQYVNVIPNTDKEARELNEEVNIEQFGRSSNKREEELLRDIKESKIVKMQGADNQKSYNSFLMDNFKDLSTAESSPIGSKIVFPDREGRILNKPYHSDTHTHHEQAQYIRDESENKFVPPNNQRPYGNTGFFATQENFQERPLTQNGQDQPNYSGITSPSASYYVNNQVTSLNSVNNYVTNAAYSNNNYYGAEGSQTGFQPVTPSSNYFLPTPAPQTDGHNYYMNSLYPSNNYADNSKYYNQMSANSAVNSQKYATSNTNNYNSGNYNPYMAEQQNPTSANLYNSGMYNSYRPLSKPTFSSLANSGNSANYNSGNNFSSMYHRFPAKASNSLNTNSNTHNAGYPSNSNTQYDRYHSSFYTTRRPVTTPKPDDKNVYVTNGRGETEYYITPDGRKIYFRN